MTGKLLKRSFLILSLTLAAGFIINQVYSDGIPWALLKPRVEFAPVDVDVSVISADSAFALFTGGEAGFIDIRSQEEFEIDRIPGAVSLTLSNYYQSPEIVNQFDRESCYIFYCFEEPCPEASSLAREFAINGFKQVAVLYGGFSAWLERGFPVEP